MKLSYKFLSLFIVVLIALFLVAPALVMAATTASVTITATPIYIAITNAPSSYDFGSVNTSATPSTTAGYFTITNTSTTSTNITIWGTDFTGGSGWTLATAGAPGSQIAGMYAGIVSGSFNITVTTTTTTVLKSSLAALINQTWHLKLMCPTNTPTDGAQRTSTITISAAAA